MKIITIDYETAWSEDYTLTKMGPIEYIRDCRFHAQLLGVRVDRNPVQIYEHGDIPAVLAALELHRPDRIVVAHNGNGFDFLILSEIYDIHPAWMVDTQVAMRWCGYSRIIAENHASLTSFLGNGVKEAGTVISKGKQWPHDFTPQERDAFKQYCRNDVLQCSENFFSMMEHLSADVVRFMTLTAKMATEPRLELDRDKLESYIQELDDRTVQSMAKLSQIFAVSQDELLQCVRSTTIFPEMLRKLGVEPPMKVSAAKTKTARAKLESTGAVFDPDIHTVMTPACSKQDLDFRALQEHPNPKVQALVSIRLEQNSSIQKSRAKSFLDLAHGEPVPVMLQCYRALTSRYTAGNEGKSDGTQFQNLSKRDKNTLTLRRAIQAPPGYKIVSGDSSQIEARMLAYIADQTDLLDQFREGRDPYSELAGKIYGVPADLIHQGAKSGNKIFSIYRHVGKTAILSAGYQVGARKFSNTLLLGGVKLSDNLDQHHELAKNAHSMYRQNNRKIVNFWQTCQCVAETLYLGGSGMFGGPKNNLFYACPLPIHTQICPGIHLPTGFPILYPGLGIQANDYGKSEYYYETSKGKNLVKTNLYGGKIAENCTQAISFQLLAWQACRMYEAGVPLHCNIHDSWLAVVPEADVDRTVANMKHWMSAVPDWLPNFPVACEVEVGDDFTIA